MAFHHFGQEFRSVRTLRLGGFFLAAAISGSHARILVYTSAFALGQWLSLEPEELSGMLLHSPCATAVY